MDEDLRGLYSFAEGHGYTVLTGGYFSRCHLCTDIRRHLALEVGEFAELSPTDFYLHLQNGGRAPVLPA